MPFIDERRPVQDLRNIAGQAEEISDPSMLETFGAAFRTQNVVGSYLTSRGQPDPYRIENDFDAIDYVKDDPEYAPYVESFAGIFNKEAAEAQKQQIKKELQDRRTLDAAGGLGVLAEMTAGVFDLPTLLPVGGAVTAARGIGSTAVRVGIGAGIDAAASEAALQATQQTRTGEETAVNIGGSIILGGALGGLVGRYFTPPEAGALSRKIEGQDAAFDEVSQALISAGRAASVGAAARDVGPLVLKDEAALKKLYGINMQDPMIRLQLSELDEARSTVRGLAETPLEYADNAAGVATEKGGSTETLMKLWNAPLANTLRNIDTYYARYFNNAPEVGSVKRFLSPALSEFDRLRGSGNKLTYKQFKQEVSKAAVSGERHQVPEVAAAAAEYRKFDEWMKNKAIEAGIFPEDVSVAGDLSHLFRMYNRQKIIAERGDFASRLKSYFVEARDSAIHRSEENDIAARVVEYDRRMEDYDRSFQRLGTLEDRMSERSGIRERKVSALQRQQQTRIDALKDRAPADLVKMLRGADDQAGVVSTVKAGRVAARQTGKKEPYAVKYPVLSILREKGGVRVGSPLDQQLRAMGVTPQSHPGLFRKEGGIGAADNIVASEHSALVNNVTEGPNGYADPDELMEAVRREVGGDPLRTVDEATEIANAEAAIANAEQWLDSVGLGRNATVKDVRDFISRVRSAEKNVYELDERIARMEQEIEQFDQATDRLRNERDISAAEAAEIADEVTRLEEALNEVRHMANNSPRISLMVDYAATSRKLFKKRMSERNMKKRIGAIERIVSDGRATDEMLLELSAKKMDMATAQGDIGKLVAKAEDLKAKIPSAAKIEKEAEFAGLSDPELESLVDETINTILGNSGGRIPYDSIVSGPRGPLKERLLRIPSERIFDFMELDIEHVVRSQVRTMSADVELAKKFGSVDLSEQLRKINDEADAKIAKAETPKQRQKLEAARKAAIRDVEGIRDRLRGQYALPDNPDGLVLRAGRVIRNLNYLRLLGGMTISAIPDMAKPVFNYGLTSTFRDGFIPLVTNFRAFRLAAEEVKAAGTALDMILDSRAMALADVSDDFGRHSKFERGIQAMSSRFGVVSLMAPWNAAAKQFTGMITMTRILQASQKVANGTATAKEIRALAASNIDPDMASRIAKQFVEHGDTQGGVLLARGERWSDTLALESFRAAVVREVDKTIVTPGQDKPLWMSTELGKVVGQFRSFGIASMQKTTLAGLQQRDTATLNGTLVMLGLGALTYKLKMDAAGKETSDNPSVWAVEAFDRSGLLGWLFEVNNTVEKVTRGTVGLSAVTGEQISRYASRNAVATLLGPSVGTVQDILDVTGSAVSGDFQKADARKLRQLIPAQNLFYLRGLFNTVEAAATEDLPGK